VAILFAIPMRRTQALCLTLLLSACSSSQVSTGEFTKPEERLPPTDRIIRQPAMGTSAVLEYPQPEYNGVKYDFMLPGEQTESMQSTQGQKTNQEKITHGEILGKDGQPLSAEQMEQFKKGCTVYRHTTTQEFACYGCSDTVCAEPSWRYEPLNQADALSQGLVCMRTDKGCALYEMPSPDESMKPLIAKAIEMLAQELERDSADIQFLSIDAMDWPDVCLGIIVPNIACERTVTPGYRMYLTVGTVLYEYRSDKSGETLKRNILRR